MAMDISAKVSKVTFSALHAVGEAKDSFRALSRSHDLKVAYRRALENPFANFPQREWTSPLHRGIIVTPKIPIEMGRLNKINFVCRDCDDPSSFNHFVSIVFHPKRIDPNKPLVVIQSGMLCNGNLARISWTTDNYRNLDKPTSLANALAFEGYSVAIVHRRTSEWIYNRFVWQTLGIPNRFDERVDFNTGVNDLYFLIDAANNISRSEGIGKSGKVVVLGYSMGGMELLDLLAFKRPNHSIAGTVFLGTPVRFDTNKEVLISLIRLYGQLARFLPVEEYRALNLASKHMILLKDGIKLIFGSASPDAVNWAMSKLPLVSELFNVSNPSFDPESIIPLASYVLEPQPTRVIEKMLGILRCGRFNALEGIRDNIDPERRLPPWLVLRGGDDRFVTEDSNNVLSNVLSGANMDGEKDTIPGFGHVDCSYSYFIAHRIIDFLNRRF